MAKSNRGKKRFQTTKSCGLAAHKPTSHVPFFFFYSFLSTSFSWVASFSLSRWGPAGLTEAMWATAPAPDNGGQDGWVLHQPSTSTLLQLLTGEVGAWRRGATARACEAATAQARGAQAVADETAPAQGQRGRRLQRMERRWLRRAGRRQWATRDEATPVWEIEG
jgi:hypothetical protein